MRRARLLVGGLLDIPQSRYRAAAQGDPKLLGYDLDRELLMSLNDRLLGLIRGLSGKPMGAWDLWDRPEPTRNDEAETVGTIADFDAVGFMRVINS